MFSKWSDVVCRGFAAGALTIALPTATMAARAQAGNCVAAAAGGPCDYTAEQEGAHRIDLTLATNAPRPKFLRIAGQECLLSPPPDGAGADGVRLSCFAYLAGGTTYSLSVPPAGGISIVRAEPTRGEPVTLIP